MLPERGDGVGRGSGEKRASAADGLRFLGARPNLRMTFFSDLCPMVLVHPRALFPVVAVVWYGGDAKTTTPGTTRAIRSRDRSDAMPSKCGARSQGQCSRSCGVVYGAEWTGEDSSRSPKDGDRLTVTGRR